MWLLVSSYANRYEFDLQTQCELSISVPSTSICYYVLEWLLVSFCLLRAKNRVKQFAFINRNTLFFHTQTRRHTYTQTAPCNKTFLLPKFPLLIVGRENYEKRLWFEAFLTRGLLIYHWIIPFPVFSQKNTRTQEVENDISWKLEPSTEHESIERNRSFTSNEDEALCDDVAVLNYFSY